MRNRIIDINSDLEISLNQRHLDECLNFLNLSIKVLDDNIKKHRNDLKHSIDIFKNTLLNSNEGINNFKSSAIMQDVFKDDLFLVSKALETLYYINYIIFHEFISDIHEIITKERIV
jgi:hypothetical protein